MEPAFDLAKTLRPAYTHNTFFRIVIDNTADYCNFKLTDGLLYLKDQDKRLLCIPAVTVNNRSLRELIIAEAHSLLAHLGARKTLHYIRENTWWPKMLADVKAFCASCHTCQCSKTSTQKPYGPLRNLDVPS